RVAFGVEVFLRGGEHDRVAPHRDGAERAARRTHAHVEATGLVPSDAREEVVSLRNSARRKQTHATTEKRLNLRACAAHGGRGTDNLRRTRLSCDAPIAQIIDGSFVQADHRPERPTDEVKLVLYDEL